jgi:hypothetical protein
LRASATLLALAHPGCAEELDRLWTSEHFEYRSRPDDDTVCEEVLQTLEAHRAEILGHMGLDSGSVARRVEYRKYRDGADLLEHGPCDSRCAAGRTLWTHVRFDEHELIHAYLNPWAFPHPLLSEGVATALSCNPAGAIPEGLELEDVLAWNPEDWALLDLYRGAATLVGHLLRSRGPAALLAWYAAVSRRAAPDEIRREYANAYGDTLEDAWSQATVTRDRRIGCVPLWPQAQPRVAAGDWSLGRLCDGSDAYRVFELASEGLLRWSVDSPSSLWLARSELEGRDAPDVRGWTLGQAVIGLHGMEPGTYYFASARPSDTDSVSFDPLSTGGLGTECEALPAARLEPNAEALIHIPMDGRVWFVRLEVPEPTTVSMAVPEAWPFVTTCTGCDPASCEPLAFPAGINAHVEAELLIRVDAPSSPQGHVHLRAWNVLEI